MKSLIALFIVCCATELFGADQYPDISTVARVSTPVVAAAPADTILPWRKGQEKEDERLEKRIDSIPTPQAPQPPCGPGGCPVTPDIGSLKSDISAIRSLLEQKNEKPEPKTIREKIADKGFLKTIRDKMDDSDGFAIVALIFVAILVYGFKKYGGLHGFVESKLEKLKADEEAGGLKGKIAGRIIDVHEGAIGNRLDDLEARIQARIASIHGEVAGVKSVAESAEKQAISASEQLTQVALAVPAATPAASKPVNDVSVSQPAPVAPAASTGGLK
ncbi:MAG: hypothetical protein WC919_07510 [Candidatus Paceibacterota bacterium]|jgi:hypothetical protein